MTVIGALRNGGWILAFYLSLALLLVPATVFLSTQGATPGLPLQALLVVAATGIVLALRREPPRSVLGPGASWARGVPAGIAAGLVIWGAAAAVLHASGAVTWTPGDAGLTALRDGAVDCLAVAIAEELLFRGFPFQRLVAGIGRWPAQIAMGAYFVLVHAAGLDAAGELRSIAIANIFLASLLFGAAALRTRSLAVPVSLHFALNFVQGPVLGFGVSGHAAGGLLVPQSAGAPSWWTGAAFGLEASVPGTLAILAALIAVLAWPERARSRPRSRFPDVSE
ncbi:MAG: lysostaphin resistance A-like protein [Luteimonas sp.]